MGEFSNAITQIIADIYPAPAKEMIPMPGNKIKVKKTIEIEEEIKSSKEIIELNYLPGNVALIGSILFILYKLIIGDFLFGLLIGVPTIILGLVLRAKFKIKKNIEVINKVKIPKEIEIEEDQLEEVCINNKYKVNKVGRMNLYFSVIPAKDVKILISEDSTNQTEFTFPIITNPLNFSNEFYNIQQKLEEVPDILHGKKTFQSVNETTNYGDKVPLIGYEKEIIEYINYVIEALRLKSTKEINLSLISDTSFSKHLEPSETLENHYYALEYMNFINGDNGESLENLLNEWKNEIPKKIDQINDIRIYSLNKELSTEFLSLGQTSHFGSFNFYCPDCNKEITEEILIKDYSVYALDTSLSSSLSRNTRCIYLPDKNTWKCLVCNLEHISPIPVHKTLDEILLPTYDKLIEEHKIEREKSNSDTRNKELVYRKELKSKIDEINYNSLNQIFALEDEMERMKAEISGQAEAINYMKRIALNFREISSDLLTQIQNETSEVENRVSERAKEVTQMLVDYKNKELSSYDSKMNELSRAKRLNDERREAIMRDTLAAVKDNTAVIREMGERVEGAVNNNTAVAKEMGERVEGAVKDNTLSNRVMGERIEGAVKDNTSTIKEQLKKGYSLNSAIAKQQGYNVDDYGWFRFGKNMEKSFINMSSALSGKSAVEKEMELNK